MNENRATIAIHILKEILAQETLLPASSRKIGAFQINHYVVPLKFNLEYPEAFELMNSFQNRGFIKIVSHDVSIPNPNWIKQEDGKDAEPIFFTVGAKDEDKKRISFVIKDIRKIKNFISELEDEFETGNDIKKGRGKEKEEQYNLDVEEEIKLKTHRISIKGNSISKGELMPKKVFNVTDVSLIYFLYDEFFFFFERCFNIKILAEKTKKKEHYLDNRITKINQMISKTASVVNAVKIIFIKHETKYGGYHLNPEFLKVIK